MCLVGAFGAYMWMDRKMANADYLMWREGDNPDPENDTEDFILSSIVQFFYYFLLMANFVPVSLYTSMSTVKFFQARFIESDLEMYERAKRAQSGSCCFFLSLLGLHNVPGKRNDTAASLPPPPPRALTRARPGTTRTRTRPPRCAPWP